MEIRLTESGKGEYRKKGADTWFPFNNIAAYHLTHTWDNLYLNGQGKIMYDITFDLPPCANALLILSARVNNSAMPGAWEPKINTGDLNATEIGRSGAMLKVNFATTMVCFLVSSAKGCNVTFTTADNDCQSVKIAMLLEQ